MDILTLTNKQLSIKVDKGELISFTFNSEEIIHQKEAPGWRNSDIEMFPLIGATAPNNYKVATPCGTCVQDQHGLTRELEYTLISSNSNSIVLSKRYIANTPVKNAKYPKKSPEQWLSWPYSFEFTKSFYLTKSSLKIEFAIDAEKEMPFMLGYHPAFKLSGNLQEFIKVNNHEITIKEILDAGSPAYPLLETEELYLKTKNTSIRIKTKNFNNLMLWTEVPTMLCIEPITFYPNGNSECLTPNMFRSVKGKEKFEITITPKQE